MTIELSKEEVAGLSQEQLHAYARVVLSEARTKRALLASAQGYRGYHWIPLLAVIGALCMSIYTPNVFNSPLVVLFIAMALIQWQVGGVNRRIDSLIRLLDLGDQLEKSSANGSEPAPDVEEDLS